MAVTAFEAARLRDDDRLESLVHPEAELLPLTAMMPYRGREGAREWLRTVTARYRGWAGRYDRVEHVGRAVILHGSMSVTRHEGELDPVDVSWLYVIRDGLVWRWSAHPSADEARAEARRHG